MSKDKDQPTEDEPSMQEIRRVDLGLIQIRAERTQAFSLNKFYKENADNMVNIDEDITERILIGGRQFNDKIKELRNEADLKYARDKNPTNDSSYNFVNIKGFRIRIRGEVGRQELTKKRFIAMVHRHNFISKFNVISALAQNIVFPRDFDRFKPLIDVGLEYNFDLFKENESILVASCLALDYGSFINTVDRDNFIKTSKKNFIVNHQDKMFVIHGLLRQIGLEPEKIISKDHVNTGKLVFIDSINFTGKNAITATAIKFLKGTDN